MAAPSPEQHWSETFARLEASRADEPAWLAAARKAALTHFEALGFPNRKHEEWKYTNAARIAKPAWAPAPPAAAPAGAEAPLGLPLYGPRLVFVNGRFAPDASSLAGLRPEVTAAGIQQVLACEPERLEPILGTHEAAEGAFAALAAACFADGAFVSIPRDLELEAPLHLVFLSVPGGAPVAAHPRVVVELERGAQAKLIEIHASCGQGPHLDNALTGVSVGENASLDHARLLCGGPEAMHVASFHARLARSGRLVQRSLSLGAALARHDVAVTLDGEGAECRLDGLYVTRDGEHVDNRTVVDHARPHTNSHELYKGVLSGRSRGIFNGKVIVRPDAQKIEAHQKNENLLLSANAEVDSKPQLEIHADDVKCSHGSTVGQLEDDEVFYLRSRGLAEEDARGLLTRGFAAAITAGLPGEALRERVEALVLGRLEPGDTA